ncbi:hypothetical protein [Candidatus Tisiphia endosymbiont of Ptychoptera albimana]
MSTLPFYKDIGRCSYICSQASEDEGVNNIDGAKNTNESDK